MSDGILTRLPTLTAPVSVKDERGEHHAVTNAITWVKADDVRDSLLDHKTREVIRTVMWRHKQYTTTGPVRCSCGHWKPDAGMFDMHLAEEIQKALAGGDE